MTPIGNYRAKATEYDLGFTKDGAPQVAVSFQILDGPHAGDAVPWYGYFGPQETTAERTIKSLRYCGWKGDDLANLAGLSDNEVQIVVEHNDYQGKVTARVAWVNQPGGVALQSRMDEGQRKRFAEQMMGRVLAMKQGAPPAPAAKTGPGPAKPPVRAPAPAAATGTDDDEIPF